MLVSSVINIAAGSLLLIMSILYGITNNELKEIREEKAILEQNYALEKANWEKQLQEQNALIAKYQVSEETIKANSDTKIEALSKSIDKQQEQLKEDLSKDSSSNNLMDKANEFLHTFSDNK